MNTFAQPSATPLAGPTLDGRRVLAGLIDILAIAAGMFVLGFLFGMVFGSEKGLGALPTVIVIAWSLYYYFALESGDGQTLGKKVMKLRVVRADGGATGMKEIAIRTVLRVVDGLFFYLVGLIVMLVTGQRRQRLGDMAAGTMVVDASGKAEVVAAAPAAFAPPAEVAPEAPAGVSHDEPAAEDSPPHEDEQEAPAEQPAPAAKSPVDIGTPLPGVTSPEHPQTPQVQDFNPFSPPSEQAEEPANDAPVPEPEPTVEPAAQEPRDEVGPFQGLAPSPEPAAESAVEEPVADEPQVEVAPEPTIEEATKAVPVELPAEPVAEEPVADEPQPEPFPAPAEEPVAEEPQSEPFPAPAEEPVAEEPQPEPFPAPAEEPVAEEPQPEFSPAPAFEPPAEEPQAQEPAAEEPQPEFTPAPTFQPPAEEPVAQDPQAGFTPTPAVGPIMAEPAQPADLEPAQPVEPQDEEPADEPVSIRSVEMVSAIDLVMGDDDADEQSPPAQPESGDSPQSGPEPAAS